MTVSQCMIQKMDLNGRKDLEFMGPQIFFVRKWAKTILVPGKRIESFRKVGKGNCVMGVVNSYILPTIQK